MHIHVHVYLQYVSQMGVFWLELSTILVNIPHQRKVDIEGIGGQRAGGPGGLGVGGPGGGAMLKKPRVNSADSLIYQITLILGKGRHMYMLQTDKGCMCVRNWNSEYLPY